MSDSLGHVNALIPGLVDTALTRYDKRLSESIGETGRPKHDHPTPQKAWDIRAATVPMKVGWLQPDDISPAAVFLASDLLTRLMDEGPKTPSISTGFSAICRNAPSVFSFSFWLSPFSFRDSASSQA